MAAWNLAVVLGLTSILGACGSRGGAPDSEAPASATGSCTGPAPAHATMCPGADSNLASDVPRTLTNACGSPCAYSCAAGYALAAGTCAVVAPPGARIVDNGDGTVTVTDDFGSTTWLREAGCAEPAGGVTPIGGMASWADAQAWADGLGAGPCGLRDGSVPGDWFVPAYGQLLHLAQDLAAANPFIHFQGGEYWSSWAGDWGGDFQGELARAVDMDAGICLFEPQSSTLHVWAVRH